MKKFNIYVIGFSYSVWKVCRRPKNQARIYGCQFEICIPNSKFFGDGRIIIPSRKRESNHLNRITIKDLKKGVVEYIPKKSDKIIT